MVPEMQQSFYTEWRRRMEEGDRSVTPAESCCRLWGPLATGAFLLSHPEMIPQTGTGTKRATVTAAINPDSGDARRGLVGRLDFFGDGTGFSM